MKFTQEDFWETIQTLGWDPNDDIHIEIGGTSVYEIDGAGTKWAPVKGTRKYEQRCFHCNQESITEPYGSISTQP